MAVRGHVQGTHQGELMGMPATGKEMTFTLVDSNRIGRGKLAERWAVADMLGLLPQLGAILVAPESTM